MYDILFCITAADGGQRTNSFCFQIKSILAPSSPCFKDGAVKILELCLEMSNEKWSVTRFLKILPFLLTRRNAGRLTESLVLVGFDNDDCWYRLSFERYHVTVNVWDEWWCSLAFRTVLSLRHKVTTCCIGQKLLRYRTSAFDLDLCQTLRCAHFNLRYFESSQGGSGTRVENFRVLLKYATRAFPGLPWGRTPLDCPPWFYMKTVCPFFTFILSTNACCLCLELELVLRGLVLHLQNYTFVV